VHHIAKIVIVIVVVEILSRPDCWRTEFFLKVVGIVKHKIIIGEVLVAKVSGCRRAMRIHVDI